MKSRDVRHDTGVVRDAAGELISSYPRYRSRQMIGIAIRKGSAATDANSIFLPNISRKETGRPLRLVGRCGCGE
jgi:hypothetical protein